MLNNIKTDNSVDTQEADVLGGGGLLPTDIYGTKIDLAYTVESKNGAIGVALHATTTTGKSIRQTVYITNRNKETYYTKDGEKHALPGFLLMNSLALLTVGKEITQLDTEEKVVNLYNFDAKKEMPTKVQVITDLIGKEVYAAVELQVVDKTALAGDGSYQPTGETREQNEIVKFFRASDKKTTSEITAEAEEAVFFNAWLEKNKGKTKDKSKGAAGSSAGAPKPAGAPRQPTTSLFG